MVVSAALGAVVYLGVFQQENTNVGQLQGKLEQFQKMHIVILVLVITIMKGISIQPIHHTRWKCRVLYNYNYTHTLTHSVTHTNTYTHIRQWDRHFCGKEFRNSY